MERLSMMGGSCRAVVGEPAPRFRCQAVISGRIKEVSLHGIMADKQWLLLCFFPSAWSYVCPSEILAFNARIADFSARQCAVVFVSTDSEYVLKAWNAIEKEEGGLGGVNVPMLSDRSHRLSKDYGVLIEETGIAQRATFIIDPTGIIRATTVSDVYVGRNVDESKRMLEALQFSDEFGEGCPSGWEQGDPGIRLSFSVEEKPLSTQETIQASSAAKPQRPAGPQHTKSASWASKLQRTFSATGTDSGAE